MPVHPVNFQSQKRENTLRKPNLRMARIIKSTPPSQKSGPSKTSRYAVRAPHPRNKNLKYFHILLAGGGGHQRAAGDQQLVTLYLITAPIFGDVERLVGAAEGVGPGVSGQDRGNADAHPRIIVIII